MRRPQEADQLARLANEVQAGTWLANARQRSQRRKSAWNLLLPLFGLPLWGAFALLTTWLGFSLHAALRPLQPPLFRAGAMTINDALVGLPALFSAVGPALLLTNVIVYLVPPARRAMDREDRNFPGTGYNSSQRALFKGTLWMLAVCYPLILAGAVLP
jgi:hypothetical protein